MAGKKIGIVLALDGERQFSQGVSNAKKESAMLNSELKKLSTEYKGNANSLEFLTKKQENLSKQTESYQKRAESAKKGLENAQKVSQKAAQRYEELSKALKEAEKAQENMQKSGKDGTKEYQQQSKEVESLQKAVEKQGLECQKCEGKVSDWSKKVSDAENDIEKNNQALKQNEKYLQEAQNATDKCAKSINEYGKETTTVISTTKEFGESLKEGFGEALAAKGLELAGEAISAIGDKAKEAAEYVVEVGSSFEAGMSEVEAISGATGSELEALENKAKSLGSSTKFSATEAASAMTNMSLAGWSVNQTLSGIDGVLQLAAASNMDLADASQIVTDNISTFNLEASQSTHLADMMAYAQANSSTTAAELGEAYKNCGANMNAAGQDIETTTSFLEALANNGLRSSEAGTSLAAIMRDLTSKMKDGKIAIGDTSVTVMDSNGNFRDMTDVLKDVESATDGMGDAQKQAALMATFTSDSIKGLNMLLTAVQMAANSITTEKIAAGSVTADKIDVVSLFAKDIEASGSISGVKIVAREITANQSYSIYNGTNSQKILYFDGSSIKLGKMGTGTSIQGGAGFEFFDKTVTMYGDLSLYSGDITTPGNVQGKTITATADMNTNTIYASNWFRSRGTTGWYSEDYGGGWYMTDSDWIRAYNGKGITTNGNMSIGGYIQSNNIINTTYEYQSNRGSVDWRFSAATGTGDENFFSFYKANNGMIPLAIDGNFGNIYVGFNVGGSGSKTAVGVYLGAEVAGSRAFIYHGDSYAGSIWIQTRLDGSWKWFSLGRACSAALSDIRLKDDIRDTEVQDATKVIEAMQIRSFERKDSHKKYKIGFIADELEQLDPNLVDGGGEVDGHPYYKSVNNLQLLAYVVKAMQELSSKVDRLERENEELRRKLYS